MSESIPKKSEGKVRPKRFRRIMRRALLSLLLVLAAAAIRVRTRELPRFEAAPNSGLRGVFHIHSDASHDGRVPYAELVDAGRRLGVDFLVFTDHNRQLARAQPEAGPIIVSGSELSTTFGHLIQLGLDSVPGKAMRDSAGLTDFLHEQGAIAIASHPESPKRPWTGSDAGLDGFEIASSSADLRVRIQHGYHRLAGPLAAYLVHRKLALAQLYRRDDAALQRWDARSDSKVIGLCGTDTHGWIAPHLQYSTWQVVLDELGNPPEGAESEDIIRGLAEGRFICVASLLDGAPRFQFTGEGPGLTVRQGSTASADSITTLEVSAPVLHGSPAVIALFRDGSMVSRTEAPTLSYDVHEPGTYRVEILARLPRLLWGNREVPVLYSNRIRLLP
jgi:hypothetical protein